MNSSIVSYERPPKNSKTVVYRFSISYLVLELQSFEDAKIKANYVTCPQPLNLPCTGPVSSMESVGSLVTYI